MTKVTTAGPPNRIVLYVRDTRAELRKVVWPTHRISAPRMALIRPPPTRSIVFDMSSPAGMIRPAITEELDLRRLGAQTVEHHPINRPDESARLNQSERL